jgi:hypothetical protein
MDTETFRKAVKEKLRPGTVLTKPRSQTRIIRWEKKGQEDWIFYSVGKSKRYVTFTEVYQAFTQLINAGQLSRGWFERSMQRPQLASSDYTTIGAILVHLQHALPNDGNGVYRRRP